MISLVLSGKLSITEDPLTAAFADFVRYENRVDVLRSIFARATGLAPGAALPLDFDSFELDLWPILEGREPDIRVVLKAGGRPVARLIIEAKLGAEKSGAGEIDTEARSGDQLGYYLMHEARSATGHPTALLYLTHHGSMPKADLEESAKALRKAGHGDLTRALFWLSWQEVHGILAALASPSLMAADLLKVLEKVGMFRFSGIVARPPLPVLVAPAFYSSARPRVATTYFSHPRQLGTLTRWDYRGQIATRPYRWASPPHDLGEWTFTRART